MPHLRPFPRPANDSSAPSSSLLLHVLHCAACVLRQRRWRRRPLQRDVPRTYHSPPLLLVDFVPGTPPEAGAEHSTHPLPTHKNTQLRNCHPDTLPFVPSLMVPASVLCFVRNSRWRACPQHAACHLPPAAVSSAAQRSQPLCATARTPTPTSHACAFMERPAPGRALQPRQYHLLTPLGCRCKQSQRLWV